MAEVILDGQELKGLEEIHTRFVRTLALPEYYGRNLDALFDCLTMQTEDVTIRLRHQGDLAERLGRRGGALVRLLRRAAGENPHVTLMEED